MKRLLVTISLLHVATNSAPAALSADSGWVLKQRMDFIGPATTYILPNAIKVDSPRLTIMMRAPDWKVYIFNSETKNYTTQTYDIWLRKIVRIDVSDKQEAMEDAGKLFGLKVKKFRTKRKYKRYSRLEETFETVATADIKVDPKIKKALNAIYELPPDGELVPIRVRKSNPERKEVSFTVDTFSCKKEPVELSAFKMPGGLKHVNTEMDVLFQLDDEKPALGARRRVP